ncbi:MAG: putative selenate reductase subunit YgfK [Candidatus Marinimicrobia bacterium]|nr:putative selenate reductase subunit YgfK [Candidatus Neomarinimicrobiota bacterium]
MLDKLYPMDLRHMLAWILEEEKHETVFGIHEDLFFHPKTDDLFRTTRYGQQLETPIGVAAGPHTQMAQNIVLSWLMGARYIELKTVQTLDELDVSKPCIDMEDEGYNCEWSQELKLRQSLDEYLNAWIIIHVLKDNFGWGEEGELGVIFNMSTGYDLAGILKPNVQQFLDKMENCQPELDKKLESISDLYPRVKELGILSQISNNLTLSTMHGCPANEIESIGQYLIVERNYHITIKLNPTLLGADRVREILHDQLRYNDVVIPDEAFEHDLKYLDALNLIRNLQESADQHSVEFGIKLTNTLEVKNHKSVFPAREKMMYLSGRALHPISINLAARLQGDFGGKLDISFCAGVDVFNVTDVLATNMKPVTVCTDILKPGGYLRLAQYLDEINSRFATAKTSSIEEFILNINGSEKEVTAAALSNLQRYAKDVLSNSAYIKGESLFENIKTDRELTAFDCVRAPCIENCAIQQDIPDYLYQMAQGDFDKAYKTIIRTNPFPGVTGFICDHLCQLKCMRNNLDSTLLIREIKRFVMKHSGETKLKPAPSNGMKVAVLGAGPSGLSCAYFLALDGFEVHIYEARQFSGGMVSAAIPVFRLTEDAIRNDLDLVKSVGVQIHYGVEVDSNLFAELRKEFDYIYLAVGAQKNKKLNIKGEELPNVIEPLTFLSRVRRGEEAEIGRRVAVIGGGNTAIDAARTTRRLGFEGTILYRRTIKEMPADMEEVIAAIEEGIVLEELTAPERILPGTNGSVILVSSKMKLGEPDESGRPRPEKIDGSEFELEFESIIPAIGQDIALDFISTEELEVNPVTGETKVSNVYAGGDAVRGASSVINAVGDGRRAAKQIALAVGIHNGSSKKLSRQKQTKEQYQKKLAMRKFGMNTPHLKADQRTGFDLVSRTLTDEEAIEEAGRCLYCDERCDICVTVCPNLANFSYKVSPRDYPVQITKKTDGGFSVEQVDIMKIEQEPQILNIGDFCNECGNCTTFCPTAGAPYMEKPRFFLTQETFDAEECGYFLKDDALYFKSAERNESVELSEAEYVYKTESSEVLIDRSDLSVKDVTFTNGTSQVSLEHAMEMIFLLENLNKLPIFSQEG